MDLGGELAGAAGGGVRLGSDGRDSAAMAVAGLEAPGSRTLMPRPCQMSEGSPSFAEVSRLPSLRVGVVGRSTGAEQRRAVESGV